MASLEQSSRPAAGSAGSGAAPERPPLTRNRPATRRRARAFAKAWDLEPDAALRLACLVVEITDPADALIAAGPAALARRAAWFDPTSCREAFAAAGARRPRTTGRCCSTGRGRGADSSPPRISTPRRISRGSAPTRRRTATPSATTCAWASRRS